SAVLSAVISSRRAAAAASSSVFLARSFKRALASLSLAFAACPISRPYRFFAAPTSILICFFATDRMTPSRSASALSYFPLQDRSRFDTLAFRFGQTVRGDGLTANRRPEATRPRDRESPPCAHIRGPRGD